MKHSEFEPGMLVRLKKGHVAIISLAKNAVFIKDADKIYYTLEDLGGINDETIMCYIGMRKIPHSYRKNFLTSDGQVIWIYDNDVTHFEPIV